MSLQMFLQRSNSFAQSFRTVRRAADLTERCCFSGPPYQVAVDPKGAQEEIFLSSHGHLRFILWRSWKIRVARVGAERKGIRGSLLRSFSTFLPYDEWDHSLPIGSLTEKGLNDELDRKSGSGLAVEQDVQEYSKAGLWLCRCGQRVRRGKVDCYKACRREFA